MNRTAIWLAACAIAAAPGAVAQDKGRAVGGMEYAKVTATVEAIDQKTREVTLRGEGGNTVSFVASAEVRNLAQVSKGDIVTIEYAQALLVALEKTKSTTRERVVTEGAKGAAPGQMPAGVVVRDVAVVASVEAIDKAKSTVTLRGPERTVTIKVRDPAVLKDVKAGDFVKASYTEAMAVKVEKGPAAKK
jgi:Cu/Ag efflux protein CusF